MTKKSLKLPKTATAEAQPLAPGADALPQTVDDTPALNAGMFQPPEASPLGNLPMIKSHTGTMFTVIAQNDDGMRVSARAWVEHNAAPDGFVHIGFRIRLGDYIEDATPEAIQKAELHLMQFQQSMTGGGPGKGYRSFEGFVRAWCPGADINEKLAAIMEIQFVPNLVYAISNMTPTPLKFTVKPQLIHDLFAQLVLDALLVYQKDHPESAKAALPECFSFGKGSTVASGIHVKKTPAAESTTSPTTA